MSNLFRRSLRRSRERLASAVSRLLPGGRIEEADLERLEEALIGADVGPDTAMDLVSSIRAARARDEDARGTLVRLMVEVLEGTGPNGVPDAAARSGPRVTLVVGVNGSGKTTTVAKLAAVALGRGESVLLGAADTFRAAAIDQLRTWSERLDIQIVAHAPGGDPSAVVYDVCEAAVARGIDRVFIDTAGRLHTQGNLMAELEKVRRVAGKVIAGAPHEVLLVLDGTTGQNGLRQAEVFLEHAGVTGLVLAKLDGTAKGGVALTIARRLGLPIRFVGIGESATDLVPFDAREYVEALVGGAEE